MNRNIIVLTMMFFWALLYLGSNNKASGNEGVDANARVFFETPPIQGLTLENYPLVDGSTSTRPLNIIVACRLLDIDYRWGSIGDGRNGVIPDFPGNNFEQRRMFSVMFFDRIRSSQTHNSFINLINNDADLILSARKMSPDEKAIADSAGVTLIETPIALDALVFIVHVGNAIESLTDEQIRAIYASRIKSWDEVGAKSARPEIITLGAISPFVRNQNSGSEELMNLLVMQGLQRPPFSEHRIISNMMGPIDTVARVVNAISYTVYYYKEHILNWGDILHPLQKVKTIAVNGVHASAETIADKSYPFISEVYAVIRSDLDRSSPAYKIYEWLQTDTGKRVIAESRYVPF